MKILAVLLGCAFLILEVHAQTNKYCLRSLCQTGTHVACVNSNTFAVNCPRDAKLVTNGNYIDNLVKEHNHVRNQLTLGKVAPYKAAMRMGTIQWNSELATLAQISLKRCLEGYDECRNTAQFSRVGQNKYTVVKIGPYNTTELVIEAVQAWFSENTGMDIANVATYTASDSYRNFAQLAYDKVTFIGCAIVEYTVGTTKQVTCGCNYSSSPANGDSLYVEGCPLSQCLMGRNNGYFGLCSTLEVIDPNP